MLKEERFNHILHKLQHNKGVILNELSTDLNVSEDTIRRDIEALSQSGKLIKARGGAIPHSPNSHAHAFKDRIHVSEEAKEVIAGKAIHLLQPGQTILLDGGTTTYTMARMLPVDTRITVITNSIPIASVLMEHPFVEMIFAGGRIFKSSQVTVGMEAIHLLQKLRVDLCFTGICSLHEEFGISAPDMDEAEVKRSMVRAAGKVVAVTTADKIGTAEAFKVCDIEQVGTIITEVNPEEALFGPYRALGIEIL